VPSWDYRVSRPGAQSERDVFTHVRCQVPFTPSPSNLALCECPSKERSANGSEIEPKILRRGEARSRGHEVSRDSRHPLHHRRGSESVPPAPGARCAFGVQECVMADGLSPQDWETVKDLVFECQEEQPRDLTAWLEGHCPSQEVRAEVERLLRSASTCGDFLQHPPQVDTGMLEASPPERIGRYRILEQLGAGGMGVVYAALDEELGRRVAIKVLPAAIAFDAERQKRLREEAKTASALQHPNIITVYEIGTDRGMTYIAMECIQGQTLAKLIGPEGMGESEAVGYAVQIASGLAAAHNERVVHRDLKPGNVMVTESGTVKILDFGLSKHGAPALRTGGPATTLEGHFAGTASYMAPEQAEGKSVDTRADIFSFGTVLFEMLTGQKPFTGETPMSTMAKILHTEAPSVRDVKPGLPPALAEIVERCLRRNRDLRFQSIAEVKVRLTELEKGAPAGVPAPADLRPPRPRRGRFWAGAMAGCALTATAAIGVFRYTRPEVPTVTLRRVTYDGGLAKSPALSPDGNLVAYASDRGGRGDLDIWVQQVSGGAPVRVTSDEADDSEPTWSPDGMQVAYRSERDGGGIYINSYLGGAERLIVHGGHNPQFSPDGRSLAYWTGEAGSSLYPGSTKVWVIPVGGGLPAQVHPEFSSAAFPIWSPDGGRLLFLARSPKESDRFKKLEWWVADVQGEFARLTGLTQYVSGRALQFPPNDSRFIPTMWLRSGGSDDDGLIFFQAMREDATNIYAQSIDKDGALSGNPQRWTGGTLRESGASGTVLSKRTVIAFAAMAAKSGIWRMPLSAGGTAAGGLESVQSGLEGTSTPALNRTGSEIVFAARHMRGQFIYRREVDSGELKAVTAVRSRRVAHPVLSGDGKTLTYYESPQAFLTHLPSGTPVKVCESCGVPSFVSFDGREVLLDAAAEPERILISQDGGTPRPLLELPPHRWNEMSGQKSPNGKWVVFVRGTAESADRQILLAPVRTGLIREDELVAITDGTSVDTKPTWSPDGKRIYYLSKRGKEIRMREVDPVTARPLAESTSILEFPHARRVLEGGSGAYSGDVGLSVAGQSLYFTLSDYSGDIWLQITRVGR